MPSRNADSALFGAWGTDHLILLAAVVAVLALIALNAAATAQIFGGAGPRAAKRLLLAAIWGAPGAGLLVLARARLERASPVAASPAPASPAPASPALASPALASPVVAGPASPRA